MPCFPLPQFDPALRFATSTLSETYNRNLQVQVVSLGLM